MDEVIEKWQLRARAKAAEFSRHKCKEAVRAVTPTDEEARALYELYETHSDDIAHWCAQALAKAQGEDAPPLDQDDLMAEAYILFQRSLVRYQSEKAGLRTHLQHDLRGRIRDYLKSVSAQTRAGTDQQEQKDEAPVAPAFDLPKLYTELIEEVDEEAKELWEEAM